MKKLTYFKTLFQRFKFSGLLILITIIPYLNSFTCSFQLDDYHIIQINKQIGNIEKFFDFSIWSSIFYNRQLSNLTFTINYLIDGFNIFGYHAFNLLIHLLNVLLVFNLVNNLFETPSLKNIEFYKDKKFIAFFTAVIFAVHPIQVQAVTYITQRMVSLSIFFYLSGMLIYIKTRLQSGQKLNAVKYLLLFICFVFGIYSKEIIFSLPIAIIFIELLFFKNSEGKLNLKFILSIVAFLICASAIIMIKNGFPQQAEAPTPYHYFLTQLTVLVIYIRLLFIPLNQHLYYLVAVKNNLFDAAVLSSTIFIIIIIAIGIYFYKKNKLISFAIGMFFISQIIESSIFPFKYLLFEYRLYLSTISVGLLISTVLLTYFKKKYAITALSVIAFIYCILTFNQNSIWQNPIKLWTNNVEKSPKNPVANNNLGSEYMMVNDFENAFKFFNKAIELDSNYADPYSQRAVIFSNNKNYSAAIKDAFKAIKLNPKIALFYNNRGYIYQSWGNYDSAIADFKKAIELEPTYHNAMKNISVLLIAKNKLKEAMLFANKSIELDSTKEDYWNNRGNVFFALNDFGNAEKDYQKSVAIKYNYARGLHNIGVLKLKQNQIDDAINYFNLALQQNDKFVDSYFYRGYSFLLKNIAQLAFQDLRQCLLLAPNHEGARQLMNQYFSSPPNNNLR